MMPFAKETFLFRKRFQEKIRSWKSNVGGVEEAYRVPQIRPTILSNSIKSIYFQYEEIPFEKRKGICASPTIALSGLPIICLRPSLYTSSTSQKVRARDETRGSMFSRKVAGV